MSQAAKNKIGKKQNLIELDTKYKLKIDAVFDQRPGFRKSCLPVAKM